MKKALTILAWLAFLCGATTYFIAWGAILGDGSIWGIQTTYWFYDSISAILIAIFLLLTSEKRTVN